MSLLVKGDRGEQTPMVAPKTLVGELNFRGARRRLRHQRPGQRPPCYLSVLEYGEQQCEAAEAGRPGSIPETCLCRNPLPGRQR